MERYEEIERSLITTYRKRIWNEFTRAIREFELIEDGDKIAVCISGGKDSMLLAKLFQELKKHGKQNFDVIYLNMNPGYNEENRLKVLSNAELLNIPLVTFETNIFNVVTNIGKHPCYICARMRRGFLYKKAKELGCNKIALGHHFDDVIETILMGMLYGSQMQTMMPKVFSTSHPGMELIRPLYYVKEADIVAWQKRNNLEFIRCACRFTENYEEGIGDSKRAEVKKLINNLRQIYNKVDINILRSAENVNLDTLISYHKKGEPEHHFLEDYRKKKEEFFKSGGLKMKELVLEVEGMMCEGCENRVQNVLKIVDGVENVVADHEKGTVTLTLIKDVNLDFLKKKLEDIGYTVK